jgi:hypothetical protein
LNTYLGKEEAPASHLIDARRAVGRFYVNFCLLLMFCKVWVYSSALFCLFT